MQIKNYGHDLLKLFASVSTENFGKKIHNEILAFLNKFAKSSRYYNIDVMANNRISNDDPLAEWKDIQDKILKNCRKRNVMRNKEKFAELMDRVCITRFHDLKGNEINNYLGILNESENIELIQGYSTQYVFEIILFLVKLIENLERKKYLMPVVSEFFSFFSDYWTSYQIRNKKNWLSLT